MIVDRPRFGEHMCIVRGINGTGVISGAHLLAWLMDNDAGHAGLDLGGCHNVTFLDDNVSWFIASDIVIFKPAPNIAKGIVTAGKK